MEETRTFHNGKLKVTQTGNTTCYHIGDAIEEIIKDKMLVIENKQNRLTYKSQFGDYGITADHDRYKIYDALGRYEDLGTVEYLTDCVEKLREIGGLDAEKNIL